MTPILESLSLPFRLYEAATPLALWLMVEGFANEDLVFTLCGPMIWAAGEYSFIAKRQDIWIDAVCRLKSIVYLFVGRKLD